MKALDKRLAKNIFSLLVLQGAGYIFPLITLPYLARVLQPTCFGKVAIAQALASYGNIIVDWGFNLSTTMEMARRQDDKQAISSLLWNTTASRCLLAFALLALIALAMLFPPLRPYFDVALASWMVTFSGVLFPLFLFRGMENMGPITWINIGARVSTIPLVFIIIKTPADYLWAIYVQALTGLAIGILAWQYIIRQNWITWVRPDWLNIKGSLVRAWPMFFSNAAISLYTFGNTLLLGAVSTVESVGLYSAADKLRTASQGLWAPVSNAVFPRAASLAAQDKHETMKFLRKYAKWCLLINGSLSLGILITAPWVVPLLFGPNYHQAIPVLQIISVLPLFIGLSNLFGIQTMIPFGMQKHFSAILGVAAIVNLVLVLCLGKIYSAVGAAISISVTEFLVASSACVTLYRHGFIFWQQKRLS